MSIGVNHSILFKGIKDIDAYFINQENKITQKEQNELEILKEGFSNLSKGQEGFFFL